MVVPCFQILLDFSKEPPYPPDASIHSFTLKMTYKSYLSDLLKDKHQKNGNEKVDKNVLECLERRGISRKA